MLRTGYGEVADHLLDTFDVGIRDSGRLEPADSCFGYVPLLLALELICFSHLAWNTLVIYNTSSVESMSTRGVAVSPDMQVANATWALIGVPIIICAGVGGIYRIERMVRFYCYYMCASLVLGIAWVVVWVMTGGACESVVDEGARRLGSHIVCGTTIAMLLFFGLWLSWAWLYCIYIVWSAAEQVMLSEYPDVAFFMTMLKAQQAAEESRPLVGMQPWRRDETEAKKNVSVRHSPFMAAS